MSENENERKYVEVYVGISIDSDGEAYAYADTEADEAAAEAVAQNNGAVVCVRTIRLRVPLPDVPTVTLRPERHTVEVVDEEEAAT